MSSCKLVYSFSIFDICDLWTTTFFLDLFRRQTNSYIDLLANFGELSEHQFKTETKFFHSEEIKDYTQGHPDLPMSSYCSLIKELLKKKMKSSNISVDSKI